MHTDKLRISRHQINNLISEFYKAMKFVSPKSILRTFYIFASKITTIWFLLGNLVYVAKIY